MNWLHLRRADLARYGYGLALVAAACIGAGATWIITVLVFSLQ